MYYGVVDLEAGDLTLFNEYNFRFSEIMHVGTQLLITEGLELRGEGELRDESADFYFATARDEIILINTETLEMAFVQLDEQESAHVQLLDGGDFFVTITGCRSYLRKYEIIDGTSVRMAQQVPLRLTGTDGPISIFPITDSVFAIHQFENIFAEGEQRQVELVRLP